MHVDEYFDDLGVAYRAEIKELYDLGCRKCLLQLSDVTTTIDSALTLCYVTGHIQFDDPTFCYFCNDGMIKGMEAAGVDHEALLDTYIRAINVCTQGRADDLTVGVHMCRGNFRVSTPGYSLLTIKVKLTGCSQYRVNISVKVDMRESRRSSLLPLTWTLSM